MPVYRVKVDCDHNGKKLAAGALLESASDLAISFPDRFSLQGSQAEVAVQQDVPLAAKSVAAVAAAAKEPIAPERKDVSDDDTWGIAALDHGVSVFHVDAKIANGGGYFLMSGDKAINDVGLAKNHVKAAILATGE